MGKEESPGMPAAIEPLMSPEEERELHRRLVEGDVTAPAELAIGFLKPLVAWLVEKNSWRIAEELCNEAAEDALIGLMKSPQSFNPARGKRLVAYLRMSAQGDLRNILRRESLKRHHQIRLEDVELSPQAGKYLAAHDDPSLGLDIQEECARATTQVVSQARDGLTAGESRALDLTLQGERKTAVFAEALGIGNWPTKEQRAEVKRVKDKLKKRLKRGRGGDGQAS
jgi:RNA polymerase sigma-70 factor (ECF subfamily)